MEQFLAWIREMMADESEDIMHDYELVVQLGDKDMSSEEGNEGDAVKVD